MKVSAMILISYNYFIVTGLRNEPITEETVQEFVQQMMPLTFKLRPVPTYEKQQKLPTFLLNKLQKRNFKVHVY